MANDVVSKVYLIAPGAKRAQNWLVIEAIGLYYVGWWVARRCISQRGGATNRGLRFQGFKALRL